MSKGRHEWPSHGGAATRKDYVPRDKTDVVRASPLASRPNPKRSAAGMNASHPAFERVTYRRGKGAMLAFVADPSGVLLLLCAIGMVVFVIAPFVALQYFVFKIVNRFFPFPKDELPRPLSIAAASDAAARGRCAS